MLDLGVGKHDRLLVLVGPLQGLQDSLFIAASVEVEPGKRLKEPRVSGKPLASKKRAEAPHRVVPERGDGPDEQPG